MLRVGSLLDVVREMDGIELLGNEGGDVME